MLLFNVVPVIRQRVDELQHGLLHYTVDEKINYGYKFGELWPSNP